ncbi:histidine phosphatase family protein [Actinoplanes sp. NPDC026619]|uniref:histidine phosphatase family protein n=1 Tax=Actinoplanes sp. NPDC026619 TaxID=3155798 RepID=UPI0033EE1789
MPPRLLLIRHAMPEIEPAVPAERWHLSEAGRAAARELAPRMPAPAYYVASSEPKARETLREIAPTEAIAADARFAEVRRPPDWTDGDTYRAAARAYVRGERHAAWEPHDEVIERFGAAVADHAARTHRTLVIGTHGLALTVWLASRVTLDPGPEQFWSRLRLPDLIDASGLLLQHRSAVKVRFPSPCAPRAAWSTHVRSRCPKGAARARVARRSRGAGGRARARLWTSPPVPEKALIVATLTRANR